MRVPFCTTCDVCEKRSAEYLSWPICRECLRDLCPQHYDAATLIEADLDQPATVLCAACQAEAA